MIQYAPEATYDILLDSDSGAYFAGGVLVGSTLARDPELVLIPTAPVAVGTSRRQVGHRRELIDSGE
jgi:hypothetical protein